MKNTTGRFGNWFIDYERAKSSPEAQDVLQKLQYLSEIFGRKQSGAAIADSEWQNFGRIIGSSSFSKAADLHRSLLSFDSLIRNGVKTNWGSVNELVQPEFASQMSNFLPHDVVSPRKTSDDEDYNTFLIGQ
jgi:hypothetical protein